MNVFEDLLEELKEDNLLEETVITSRRQTAEPTAVATDSLEKQDLSGERLLEMPAMAVDPPTGFEGLPEAVSGEILAVYEEEDLLADVSQPPDQRELYRRRAMDEVSSLQMVEHVLSGIEREHMKMSPQSFDDLAVKKALHNYLQVTADINSEEHSSAEYALMSETEKWYTALSARDANISVANIRRFCENSRPVLSSQALMALARFYRNAPFSEPVRGKFDFVMTRLFSRDTGDNRRKLLFGHNEMVGHIRTLYSNWASLSLINASDEEQGLAASLIRFEDFSKEATSAPNFDTLIASDFFNRLRLFKEETADIFLETPIVAAAIDANVRIGNRFVDLILAEREQLDANKIEEKYGYTYDTIVSNTTSKTLLLVDILRDEDLEDEESSAEQQLSQNSTEISFERAPVEERRSFAVNKWLLLVTILAVALSVGGYFWAESSADTTSSVEQADTFSLAGSGAEEYVQQSNSSSETVYAIMKTTWEGLSEDEKKAVLRKAYDFAVERRMTQVNFMNERGRTVGYASQDSLDIFAPQ